MPETALPADVRAVTLALAQPQPMRRGSLGERFMKCGKAGCACHRDPKARHGPYFVLTRGVDRTTQSRFLTSAQVQLARAQLVRGAQFREQIERYWEACERWADAELETAVSEEAAKGGASKRPSRRRSRPRSRRS